MADYYDLPTQRYAGRFIVQLDPLVDWSSNPAVIVASDGTGWLDFTRLPVSGGGTENRVLSFEVSDNADQPVKTLRAVLQMVTGNGSISSGATSSFLNNLSGGYSPALFAGRRIVVQEPLGSPASTNPADWRPIFWGHIDEHPASSSGELQVFARDASALLMGPYIGEPVWIGNEGELVPLNLALQLILDAATDEGEWVLHTPDDDLEWAIPAFEMGEVTNVLQFLRDAAQQRGAVVRWWFHPSTGRFQLTLFVLQQEKGGPDFSFAASQTLDIPAHGSDAGNYRNDFTLRYVDEYGVLDSLRRPATSGEILAFGRRPLLITEGATSHINSEAEAEVMLDSVESALRVPATIGARLVPYSPLVEINSLLSFGSDGRVSTATESLYVVSYTHRVAMSGVSLDASTRVELRGAPVGQLGAWLRSIAGQAPQAELEPPPPPPLLVPYVESESGSTGTFGVRVQNPGAYPCELYYRTKSGTSAWTSWTLKEDDPLEDTTYSETVALIEDHLSFIEFRLDYLIAGDEQSFHLKSSGFDRGQIPNITIQPMVIEPSGQVGINVTGDFDTNSIRLGASVSVYPAKGTVQGLSPVNFPAGVKTIPHTSLLTSAIAMGQTMYISALGYSGANGTGNESPELVRASITRSAFIAPKIQVTGTRVGTTATVTVNIVDPLLRVTAVQYRIRSGGSVGSYSSSWTSSSGTIGSSTSLTRTLQQTVNNGTDIEIEWRVTYTDEGNSSRNVGDSIPVSNLQTVTKNIRIPYTQFVPQSEGQQWFYVIQSGSGYLRQGTANVALTAVASVVLPKGVLLQQYRKRVYRVLSTDVINVPLWKVDASGAATFVANPPAAGGNPGGWHTVADTTLNETVGDDVYVAVATMNGPSQPHDARLAWIEIQYEMGSYAFTY